MDIERRRERIITIISSRLELRGTTGNFRNRGTLAKEMELRHKDQEFQDRQEEKRRRLELDERSIALQERQLAVFEALLGKKNQQP